MTELERLCDRLMAFDRMDRICRGGGRLDVLEESYELLKELRADNARLLDTLAEYMATPDDGVEVDAPPMQLRPELQPCGHPTSAIRSTPYIGDQHSNYCGWCLDVTRFECEHQLCQSLTAELLAYREKVAWLRQALEDFSYGGPVVDDQGHELEEYCRIKLAHAVAIVDWLIRDETTDDWIARHDAEVRAQERARWRERLKETFQATIHYIGTDEYCGACGHVAGAPHEEGCPFAAIREADDE